MYRIEMLPARHGDCLWVEYGPTGNPFRILIDGGVVATYDILRERILALPESQRRFELLVVTHVDNDHIEGIVKLLNDENLGLEIGDIWYNGWKHLVAADRLGPLEGEFLGALIVKRKFAWNKAFSEHPVLRQKEAVPLAGEMQISILSPTEQGLVSLKTLWEEKVLDKVDPGDAEAALQLLMERPKYEPRDMLGEKELDIDALAEEPFEEDDSKTNGSSIAFVAEFDGKRCLFSGDAYPSNIEAALTNMLKPSGRKRLKIDALKVSHHGGTHNTSVPLLNTLDCRHYLFSTDGSGKSRHPHKETIARILVHGANNPIFHFNYRSKENSAWRDLQLQREREYQACCPPKNEEGLLIELD